MVCKPKILYPIFMVKAIVGLLAIIVFMGCRPEERGHKDHPVVADSILDKADVLLKSEQVSHSLVYLDSAYSLFPHPGPEDIWKKYNFKANYYLFYDINLEIATRYVDSMFAVLKGKADLYKESYATSIFLSGDVLMAQNRYNEAFGRYYEGRQFTLKNLDSCKFSQFTYNLGLVRFRQGQYAKAIPYLKQALNETGRCKEGFYYRIFTPQAIINTTALCYERAGIADSAVYYYRYGLALLDERAPAFPKKKQFIAAAKGVIYGNLGGVYSKLNQSQPAEKYLKESIRINKRPGYEVADALTAEMKLIELYIRNKRYNDANTLLSNIPGEIRQQQQMRRPVEQLRLQWYKLNQVYADSTRQAGLAYRFALEYYHLRDSLTSISQGAQSADMDISFKIREQEYHLALVNKDDQIKRTYLISIILFSVMACMILLILWKNLKRSRKDVQELKRLNHQVNEHNLHMQTALHALEQSQRDNSRIMKIVAHDLRNPIGGIFSLALLMKEEPGRTPDDRMLLEMIWKSGKNSLDLVDSLLQINVNAKELKMEPVDLGETLHYCVQLLLSRATEKHQQITLQADPLVLSVSRDKLWRVVSNLIDNAIKFSPSGAVIAVKLEEMGRAAVITVEDHGIGIPESFEDKIFDMFTEAKRHGTDGEPTFGMGLAISKQIVEAHEGRIWFESIPGKGTTFFVALPMEVSKDR